MKIKSLVLTGAAAVIIPAVSIAAPVAADSPGVIGGGDIYRVKNLTQNTPFADSTNANACDELQYKVLLHNSGFSSATNITASANLNSVSTMTINYTGDGAQTVSDTATVNLTSSQAINYESGSTQLLDNKSDLIKALPDGVTTGGVNVGDLAGSTAEFVAFKAKVNCPTPPPVTPPSTPSTPATPAGTAAPTTLVNTGPGSAIAAFVAATIVGAYGYRRFVSRRLSRQ
jgi:hypothetical protein